MKVLCIGHTAYDITVLTDGYPKENVKYRVEKELNVEEDRHQMLPIY